VLDLLGGRLSVERAEVLRAHTFSCPQCVVLLAELAKQSPAHDSGAAGAVGDAGAAHTATDITAPVGGVSPGAPRSPRTVVKAPRRGPLVRGTHVNRYVVGHRIGQGGMGEVYEADDPDLSRRVAIKLLSSSNDSTEGRARLLREAQSLARLSHPNVVPVYDVGVMDDQVFVTMELVEGETLREWLQRERPRQGWREITRQVVDAGKGLEAAHAAGLVHRDFKPSNVMVGRDGRVRVLDFGLAKAPALAGEPPSGLYLRMAQLRRSSSPGGGSPDLTRSGAVVGTPAYMAPEQHEGRFDARSDQYAFCLVLHEALYGTRYGADVKTGSSDEARPAASRPGGRATRDGRGGRIPRGVTRILERGLKANPDLRYPDMSALLAALEAELGRPRFRPSVVVGGLLLVGAAAASLVAALTHRSATPADAGVTAVPAVLSSLQPIGRAALCVTSGALVDQGGGVLGVDQDRMRAVLDGVGTQAAEVRFTYAGAATGSTTGEVEKLALKLRAEDSCNVVHAVWQVAPQGKIVVFINRNPDAHTFATCGTADLNRVTPEVSADPPKVDVGSTHTLAASLEGQTLSVVVDGAVVWQGDLPSNELDFDGPVGVRTDAMKANLVFFAVPPSGGASTPCPPADEEH
jgi:hypothetical protein